MSGQNTLLTICEEGQSLNPETKSQLQLFFDKDELILSAKTKSGISDNITISLPGATSKSTSSAPVELKLHADFVENGRVKILDNTTVFYSYFVAATRTSGIAPGMNGASGIAQLQFMVQNFNGVSRIVVTSGALNLNTGDPEAAAWTTDMTISGNEIIVTFTGEDGKNITVDATIVRLAEVEFQIP